MMQEMQLQLVGLMRGVNVIPRHYAPVRMGFSDLLGQLWSHVVEPILSHLDISYFNNSLCFIIGY
jgi:hypothetical protein